MLSAFLYLYKREESKEQKTLHGYFLIYYGTKEEKVTFHQTKKTMLRLKCVSENRHHTWFETLLTQKIIMASWEQQRLEEMFYMKGVKIMLWITQGSRPILERDVSLVCRLFSRLCHQSDWCTWALRLDVINCIVFPLTNLSCLQHLESIRKLLVHFSCMKPWFPNHFSWG